jgi:4-amino-4-deoxy-L-arabinose transferase-like glycosyltransferase
VRLATLGGLLVLALVLRLVAGFESLHSPLQAGFAQIWDGRYYDQVAGYILGGNWLGGDEVFYLAPLYSYVLAAVYALAGGEGGLAGLPAVIVYQALAGTACVLLVYDVARRLADPMVGLIAAALAALYEPLIYQGGIVMPTVTVVLTHLLALWLLLVARERGSLWLWAASGAALAVAAIGHGTALLWAAAVAAWILLGGAEGRWHRRAAACACLIAGLAVPVLAVTARNYAVGQDLVLLTSNAGKNFYIGNNPTADGTYVPYSLPIWGSHLGTYIDEDPRGPEDPAPSEVSRGMAGMAWRFVSSEPGKTFALVVRKIELLFNWYETSINDNPYFAERYSRVLRLPLPTFGLIAPLALAGLVPALAAARRWSPLLIALAAQVVAFAIMFVLGRYRAFAAMLLIVLAAMFVTWCVRALRERRFVPALCGIAVALAAIPLVHHDVPGFFVERGFAQQHLAAARTLFDAGSLDQAREHARAALTASFAPWRNTDVKRGRADLMLGRIAEEQGRWSRAEKLYSRGVQRLAWTRIPEEGPARTLREELEERRRLASSRASGRTEPDSAMPR